MVKPGLAGWIRAVLGQDRGAPAPSVVRSRPLRPVRALPPWCSVSALRRPAALQGIPTEDVAAELLARFAENPRLAHDRQLLDLGVTVQDVLAATLDLRESWFSRQRYADALRTTAPYLRHARAPSPRPVFVDLGCGPANPYGLAFLRVMLGAKRAFALDTEPATNAAKAVTALADLAALMLVDPGALAGEHAIAREDVLRNLAGFDLAKLRAGDRSGIDATRLHVQVAPADALPVGDGEVDLLASHAFLEHQARLDGVAQEMARVLRPGGIGVHLVDATDHRSHADPAFGPLDYLKEIVADEMHQVLAAGQGGVLTTNRCRPAELREVLERHGFEVVAYEPLATIAVSAAEREAFVEPFASMPLEMLGELQARIVVRKR